MSAKIVDTTDGDIVLPLRTVALANPSLNPTPVHTYTLS